MLFKIRSASDFGGFPDTPPHDLAVKGLDKDGSCCWLIHMGCFGKLLNLSVHDLILLNGTPESFPTITIYDDYVE